jgi:hypothetical protein
MLVVEAIVYIHMSSRVYALELSCILHTSWLIEDQVGPWSYIEE